MNLPLDQYSNVVTWINSWLRIYLRLSLRVHLSLIIWIQLCLTLIELRLSNLVMSLALSRLHTLKAYLCSIHFFCLILLFKEVSLLCPCNPHMLQLIAIPNIIVFEGPSYFPSIRASLAFLFFLSFLFISFLFPFPCNLVPWSSRPTSLLLKHMRKNLNTILLAKKSNYQLEEIYVCKTLTKMHPFWVID